MQIRSCDDLVLFSIEIGSLKLALETAIQSGANLCGADLFNADICGANLSEAKLSGANLFAAKLSSANLFRADLCGANLFGSDLSNANLSGANLSGANLSNTELAGANFSRTDLSQTVLDPMNKPNRIGDEFLEVDDEWILGYRTRETSGAALILQDDRIYAAEVFSTCETECHPGWYIWPSLEASKSFSRFGKEFIKIKARKIDIHKAGSKWRSRAIWVIGTL